MRRRSTARMLARSTGAAAVLVRATMSLPGLLQRYLEQAGQHIAKPRLVEVADHAAVVHDRDRAGLFRDNYGNCVGLFRNAFGGAVACAIASLAADILDQWQYDIGCQDAV